MTAPKIDLNKVAGDYAKASEKIERRIVVCAGTGCVANGSLKVIDALVEKISAAGLDVITEVVGDMADKANPMTQVSKSGCQGFCQMGPLVTIKPEGILYCKVREDDVQEIVDKTLKGGEIVDRLLYENPADGTRCKGQDEIPFYKKQGRDVLEACGTIDPSDLGEYINKGGYSAAKKAFEEMTPEAVCATVSEAGIRGRGGGGFPTGFKWELTRKQPGPKKFVICNGDEGDPGAFMDRSVMEGNPHGLLEGMMIAARAVGADEAYIYVRVEYPLAVSRLQRAIEDAETNGILGDNIFGLEHNLKIHVMEGAGAFICGEETALIASIEGKRGMPMPKPPFPAESGLWGKPTVINNVETLASIPGIISRGAEAFKSVGTEKSPGTKTFALTGHVANTGLIEVPFGTTLREIVYNIGGGVTDDEGNITDAGFKAVQIGGPSGGCLTEDMLDMPLDFDSLKEVGAMVGSGGLVVMNKQTCMIQIAKFFMQFTQNESCGKCVPCREGTKQLLAMLEDITAGNATMETIKNMERLAKVVQKASLCGLGKTAPNPVLSTLRYFRDEYMAHVEDQRCPTGQCKDLAMPEILADKCKGCTLCKRKCPVDAIEGTVKQAHVIDPEKCIRCGECAKVCKFNAVVGI